MTTLEKTLYVGAFIHCKDLTTLDICSHGIIGVDESGTIAFISRETKDKQVPAREGWEHAKVVSITGLGFFFPGFIGVSIYIPDMP